MSVSRSVFTNATTNRASADYLFEGGALQVEIFGVLDGADVSTWARGAKNQPFRLRTCSWLSSEQDVLEMAGMGYEFICKTDVFFLIANAGSSTDISLSVAPSSKITRISP